MYWPLLIPLRCASPDRRPASSGRRRRLRPGLPRPAPAAGDPVEPSSDESGEIVDVAGWQLSSGEPATPLVWSPGFASALGEPLARSNLRVLNRTAAYRCH